MAPQIRFANKVQVWLWEGEISGQISDGAWENSTPANHYKSFWEAEVGVGAPGMTDIHPRRTYDFARADLLSVVGDRMLFVAKAAIAYPNIPNDEETIRAFSSVGDNLDSLTKHDFMKKYVQEVEAATGEDIQTVIKKVQAVPYTVSGLRRDLKQMSQIVAGKKVEAPTKEEAPAATSEVPQTLAGMTFCITGEFPETRNVITKKLESMGAAATSSVSQMTKLLIVGENPGSKVQRARQLGVKQVGIDWLKSTFAQAGIPFGKSASVKKAEDVPPSLAPSGDYLPSRSLTCSVCGNDAGVWKQWWNRDDGFGVCTDCVGWVRSRGMTPEEVENLYGIENVNWGVRPSAVKAAQVKKAARKLVDKKLGS